MTLADRIREVIEELPAEKQAEVLDFAEFLRGRAATTTTRPVRRLGTLAGTFTVPDDFDDPLPPEIQRHFDGEDDGVLGEKG